MMHYKKGKNVEEELSKDLVPIEVLPEQFLWMQVKGGTAVLNVVEYAKKALDDGSYRSVVWSGSGGGVGKTVTCAEILKRHFEMHQVTRICYRKVEEFWDPQQDGLEQIVAKRNIPCVHILMSLDEINPKVAGYQHSKEQAGSWVGVDGPRKRAQHGQQTKGGVGNKTGNYFTGPQLKKKGNRHYSNGANGNDRTTPQGKPRDRSAGRAGGSGKKGKPKDDATRNREVSGERRKDGGKKGPNSQKNHTPGSSGKAKDIPMDTSDGGTSSGKEKPASE